MEINKPTYIDLKNRVADLNQKVNDLSKLLDELRVENNNVSTSEKLNDYKTLDTDVLHSVLLKIKTPLDTLVGLAKLLSTSKLDFEERSNFAEIINNCSGELQGFFSEFMSFNSIEKNEIKVEKEQVSLNELFDDLKIRFIDQVFFKGLTLKSVKGLSDDDDTVLIDRNIITQIFTSLLSNSLKFTHKGFIEMGYQIVDSQIKFYVKDSGVGLATDLKEKLLSSKSEEELGLGLSTVKQYVSLLEGVLQVESKPDAGTLFYFKVPYIPSLVDVEVKEVKKTIKVLIADDEEISFMLLKKLMEKGNVEIIRAKNGEEAYEIYKNNPDISLVLMDLRMPQVDGYVAAQLIKNESPDVPIIAQSAYTFKGEKENVSQSFDGYLSKPVNKKEFEAVVNKYLGLSTLN
ncbi:response regulator [Flavobacterium terrae]|uniref:histidine kinase n=1 Tax=Flavobacterium terrae TaxID=415425 RepID=A0A1M6G1P9_9FLAO|nr:response regulator [Flavobacterium terrae]SHJ03863.1 Signal transduction histidine kinase [Flavobacterium terrae]